MRTGRAGQLCAAATAANARSAAARSALIVCYVSAMSSSNTTLLSHHTLNGHGGMGEGMSLQLARGGRRVLWLAHESAPKNFTAVDVTDPRKPKVIVQTDL